MHLDLLLQEKISILIKIKLNILTKNLVALLQLKYKV